MSIRKYILFGTLLLSGALVAQEHPNLILTKEGVKEMRSQLGKIPEFDRSLEAVIKEVDEVIEKGIDVPIPKDLAGGYTHEQHKRNFFILQKAGVLFQLTEDVKYATYVRDVLLEYAKLFLTIDRHPVERSYARGKFFWQCLNDANWLVYTSQAYDCIYDWIDEKTRKQLNKELFRPMADFLSIETPQFFDRIHNHSTWGNAAVGMIALVMDDDELLQRALHGIGVDVPNDIITDNDGGLITIPGQKEAGFLAQIDHSFSPDGYYTEGPYYQRYAMYPFLIFAQSLANKRPDLEIFNYRNGVLIQGVYALLNQTNGEGEFFAINDAQKGMSINSRELVTAVSLAYTFGGQDPELLSIIKNQGRVPLDDAGMKAAIALSSGKTQPYKKKSTQFSDGADGTEGGIGILRSGSGADELSLLLKYSKHGMGHGHFDKLSFLYYHGGKEVFQDYGASRWVNIEQKDGGGYLKENKTWAKQTIAHNTLVINNETQFGASVKEADLSHGELYFFDGNNRDVQVMSAKESNAYDDVKMQRTMALIKNDSFDQPLVLDLYRIQTGEKKDYDLPFYFKGHVMSANFEYSQGDMMAPLGDEFGYQHLWKEASGSAVDGTSKLSWFNKESFYTLNTATSESDEFIFGRIGANDPHFNLRRDPVLILRRSDTETTLFASVFEIHGHYSPVSELATNAYGKVDRIHILQNDDAYSIVEIQFKNRESWMFALANNNADIEKHHKVPVGEKMYEWNGPYNLFQPNN